MRVRARDVCMCASTGSGKSFQRKGCRDRWLLGDFTGGEVYRGVCGYGFLSDMFVKNSSRIENNNN